MCPHSLSFSSSPFLVILNQDIYQVLLNEAAALSLWMGVEVCQESWQDQCSFQSSSNVCYRKQGFKKTVPSFVVMWELSEQEQFIHFHFNRTAWFTVFAATFFHKFHLAALEERLKQCSLTQEKQNVGKLSPLFTSKNRQLLMPEKYLYFRLWIPHAVTTQKGGKDCLDQVNRWGNPLTCTGWNFTPAVSKMFMSPLWRKTINI